MFYTTFDHMRKMLTFSHNGQGLPKGAFAFVLLVLSCCIGFLDPRPQDPVLEPLLYFLAFLCITIYSRQLGAGIALSQFIGTLLIMLAFASDAPSWIRMFCALYSVAITLVFVYRYMRKRIKKMD